MLKYMFENTFLKSFNKYIFRLTRIPVTHYLLCLLPLKTAPCVLAKYPKNLPHRLSFKARVRASLIAADEERERGERLSRQEREREEPGDLAQSLSQLPGVSLGTVSPQQSRSDC